MLGLTSWSRMSVLVLTVTAMGWISPGEAEAMSCGSMCGGKSKSKQTSTPPSQANKTGIAPQGTAPAPGEGVVSDATQQALQQATSLPEVAAPEAQAAPEEPVYLASNSTDSPAPLAPSPVGTPSVEPHPASDDSFQPVRGGEKAFFNRNPDNPGKPYVEPALPANYTRLERQELVPSEKLTGRVWVRTPDGTISSIEPGSTVYNAMQPSGSVLHKPTIYKDPLTGNEWNRQGAGEYVVHQWSTGRRVVYGPGTSFLYEQTGFDHNPDKHFINTATGSKSLF